MRERGVTLIEVLIVAAVASILAAIAVPNYMEAQTRAKVSSTKSNLRVIGSALEMYHVDHNAYPPARRVFPHDRLAIFAGTQLDRLTDPVAYLSPGIFRDHFPREQKGRYFNHRSDYWSSANPARSLLYFNYRDLAASWEMPCLAAVGAAVVSLGPDQRDSLGAYSPIGLACFEQLAPYYTDLTHPLDTIYDPTNGTVSEGDVGRYVGGQAR